MLPVRTCVGCRQRADRPTLLRIVERDGALVPDQRGRMPGRGAYLHPDIRCLDLAVRRKALPRALRVPAPLSDGAVRDWLTGRRAATDR